MLNRLLVAGVGNIFLGDDAFGVEVAQKLAQRPLPEGVRVMEFGIRSYDLACALMDDWDLVILVDAVPRGQQPGTLYVIEAENPADDSLPAPAFDPHTMDAASVLQLLNSLGGEVKRMLVVGCEPATVEPEAPGAMGLSAPVRAAVDQAIRVIEHLIAAPGGRRSAA